MTYVPRRLKIQGMKHAAIARFRPNRLGSFAVSLAAALISLQIVQILPAAALSVTTTQMGLDSCEAPAVSQMQAFWNGTPYWWFNMYIGGSTRACANTNLSGDWINQVRAIGWKLLPTWTGAQAPCSPYNVKFSIDPGTAYNEGYNEAVAAYQEILSLGMNADTPIALDVEGFDTSIAGCVAAAQAFVNGWTDYLQIPPRQLSDVYGSVCGSAINSYASIPLPPDFIWGAFYNGNPDTGDMACVNSGYWVESQRHKQYTNTHNETYNGVTLRVDNDGSNGPVYTT